MKKYIVSLLLIIIGSQVFPQYCIMDEMDKCGVYSETQMLKLKSIYGNHWGYSYDSLLVDIEKWEQSPFVKIQSIGASTQERDIFELTITGDQITRNSKRRIFIHARTHPGEVQSFWVTNEIINILLTEDRLGNFLRENCIFHIIPMYNPDGVELEKPRENANDVDLESNWAADTVEVEVHVLRARMEALMQEINPVEVALNMHSAYGTRRYFVYHHENGTSAEFAIKEQNFINAIRNYFMDGIKPYDTFVSWSTGTPFHYPESWWWHNYGEAVMALTYEDMNDASAGDYDKTAFAMVRGIIDYLKLGYVGIEENINKKTIAVYPNPFTNNIYVNSHNTENPERVIVYDLMGKIVFQSNNPLQFSNIIWNGKTSVGNEVKPGTYYLSIQSNSKIETHIVIKR